VNELILGDCLDAMRLMHDESVDLIVTDCPYKIVQGGRTNAKKCGGGIFAHGNDNLKSGKMFKHNDIQFNQWLPEAYRLLKNGSHCYIMINGRNLAELQDQAENVGFVFQNLLVWHKPNVTPNRYYMQCLEFILLLSKRPAKSIANMGISNYFAIDNVKNKTHPTEKPIELMSIFIENSSTVNDTVLDPFMGTGATGVACGHIKRNFIGIEKDANYFNIANQRIGINI
jgi:site-specific DNA-methyltransferase (adenine-specific)